MTINEIRSKYLTFFEERGHKIIPPAPLVLQNDPTTLFTSSGMQPLVPYLMGEPHPEGKRVVDSQPSVRTQDIEEVGDNRHTTFFEMLGNWSFGDYFKKEQLPWIWEFLTEELGLPKEKLYVSIFEGLSADGGEMMVPRDEESYSIWKELGVADDHIFEYGVKKNWWSRSGTPDKMPAGEIGGPDSEIFYDFGKELELHEKSEWKDEECHPNCDCGRFMEIGNSVFIQYKKNEDGSLEELPQKNVDFGGGLERIAAAVNNDPDVFKIDVFIKAIVQLEDVTGKAYTTNKSEIRIVIDHLRAACMLIADGVEPSNKQQGYILRRLIRRAVFKLRTLGFDIINGKISTFAYSYKDDYEKISKAWNEIEEVLDTEAVKFAKAIDRGMKKLQKALENKQTITGALAFDLYQTDGFPLELTLEILKDEGLDFTDKDTEDFKKEFEIHQDKSRSAAAGTFKGGLADHSEETTRLHTVHHLILASLQKIVDRNITQKGSNITAERMRMDFNFDRKLTEEEIKQVEDLVNEMIDKDLPVTKEIMPREEAEKIGAQMEFAKKYPDMVSVYFVGSKEDAFSKEFCGGPHVNKLSDIHGHVTITKQDSVSSGVRRLYAEIK